MVQAGHGLTEEDIAKLKADFAAADKNGDGHLTADELYEASQGTGNQLTKAEARMIVSVADTDKNGTIDWNEFLTMNTPGWQMPKSDIDAKLRANFELADTNGDGHIDLEEFAKFMGMTGPENSFMVSFMFQSLDTDGDGKISFEEFSKLNK